MGSNTGKYVSARRSLSSGTREEIRPTYANTRSMGDSSSWAEFNYQEQKGVPSGRYTRTPSQSGRPGKKKKMSDDYDFGSYGGHKKKSSSSRYPWFGKSKKFSW